MHFSVDGSRFLTRKGFTRSVHSSFPFHIFASVIGIQFPHILRTGWKLVFTVCWCKRLHVNNNDYENGDENFPSKYSVSHCRTIILMKTYWAPHHHHHQSLNSEGRWGTTDDFATSFSFLHFPLFSTALLDLPNSWPVHSLMLSSHLFVCLPCLLPPFTAPCKMVLARPDERETWPCHCSVRLFTMVRSSSSGPIASWIFAWTS